MTDMTDIQNIIDSMDRVAASAGRPRTAVEVQVVDFGEVEDGDGGVSVNIRVAWPNKDRRKVVRVITGVGATLAEAEADFAMRLASARYRKEVP